MPKQKKTMSLPFKENYNPNEPVSQDGCAINVSKLPFLDPSPNAVLYAVTASGKPIAMSMFQDSAKMTINMVAINKR